MYFSPLSKIAKEYSGLPQGITPTKANPSKKLLINRLITEEKRTS